jgi:hypothetical protein
MRFLISVIETKSRPPHSRGEIAAINAFNQKLVEAEKRILAVGIAEPSQSSVIDNRSGEIKKTPGPLFGSDEYISGIWIIEAKDQNEAETLAAEGSMACNRRVELRPLLG